MVRNKNLLQKKDPPARITDWFAGRFIQAMTGSLCLYYLTCIPESYKFIPVIDVLLLV